MDRMKRSAFAVAVSCMAALLIACGAERIPADIPEQGDCSATGAIDETGAQSAPVDTLVRERISEYPVAATLDEMWERSDHVVAGRFDELKEVWNMARDPADPSKESETDRFLGQIYTFTVEEVLKGTAEEEILVNIPYLETIHGELPNAVVDQSGMIVKEATEFYPYRVERLWDYYIEPDIGQRYLLFLSYGASSGHYFPAIEPYRVSLAEDGSMSVESTLLLPEDERMARRETTYQTENGKEFRYISHAFDAPFEAASDEMLLQDFLKRVGGSNDLDQS